MYAESKPEQRQRQWPGCLISLGLAIMIFTRYARRTAAHRKDGYIGSALAVLFSGVLLVSGCAVKERQPITPQSTPPARIDGTLDFLNQDGDVLSSITIEIAETVGIRMKGLMDRPILHPMHGMLFIFDTLEPRDFWMYQTHIPLDIIFIDADRHVVNIAENTTPHSTKHINSGKPALYVVEVNAGFVKRFNISDSSRIQWKRE